MFKCEPIAADLYGNRGKDDYKYYKAMDKQPDAKYIKLQLMGQKVSPLETERR